MILTVVQQKLVSTKPLFWQSSFQWSHSGSLLKTSEITASVIEDVKSRCAVTTACQISALDCSTLLVKGLSTAVNKVLVITVFSQWSHQGSLSVLPTLANRKQQTNKLDHCYLPQCPF